MIKIFSLVNNVLDFKHYSLSGFIPTVIKNEHILWRLFGLCIIYANVSYMYYNEFLFLEPTFDVNLIYNYTILLLAQSWVLTWIFGYTPISMSLILSYSAFNILIVYTKVVFNLGWEALAQTGISAYWFYFIISHIFGVWLYNVMSPHWRRYYNDQ